MRLSAALALSDDGVADGAVLIICCLGTLRSLMGQLEIKAACVVTAVLLLLLATAIARLSDESNAVFGFETKRCGFVTSTGTTSWRAMTTRAPRFVRCQSRMAKSFVKRMQPCEAG